MSLKKKEFRSLRQGGRSVAEYVEVFNKLARYAPDDVRGDAARQEKFLEGLNDELGVQLIVATFANYQGLIDKAIVLEGKQQAIEYRKRKYKNNNGGKYNSRPHQKPRNSYGGNGGHNHGHNHNGGNGHVHSGGHNHHGGNGHNHNGHNHHNGNKNGNGNGNGNGRNNGNGRSNGANGGNGNNRQNGQAPKDLSHIQCFRCKNMGHYATDCPESNGNGVVKPNPFNKGHVNHVNVEEIYDEPDAVIGKFFINSVPALVLFYSGASHSFISRVYVDKHELPTVVLKSSMLISSPGAEMSASLGCCQMSLAIGKHVFPTNFIVLESQGLDVILGMDWLAKYQGVIDCASRSITLRAPNGQKIRYVSKYKHQHAQEIG